MDDAQQRVETLLDEQSLPVTQILVTDDRLFVALDGGDEQRRWELFPEKVETDPYAVATPGMVPSDDLVASILDRVEQLTDECSDDSYEARSTAVSASAMLTTLTCDEEARAVVLNDQLLPVLDEGWTKETLSTIWSELLNVAPDGPVREVGLHDGRCAVTINPSPESGGECTVMWFRDLGVPTESGSLCPSGDSSDVLPTMDLRDITPDDVYSALRAARAEVKIPYGAPPVEVTIHANSEGKPSFTLRNGRLRVEQVIE